MVIQLKKHLGIVNGAREPASVAQRRTAAILVADVVGYTRLMGVDQDRTYADYTACRWQLIDPLVVGHGGRVVKSTGDGFLAEFGSAVSAARCALLLQQYVAESNQEIPPDRRIVFRLGLSYGPIIADNDDIHGKEVNVAARLQTIAQPGGMAMSIKVVEVIQDLVEFHELEDLGFQLLRNIAPAVRTFHYRDPACA
jgi:adenylate cyclase